MVDGFNISKQAEIHRMAIQELSESFGSEMKPVVMEFKGKEYELTGSAEEQYKHWRELLRKIYYEETGFEQPDDLETSRDTLTRTSRKSAYLCRSQRGSELKPALVRHTWSTCRL